MKNLKYKMKKLENLISFDDFKSNWKIDQSKNTKRTETGLDILKESVEEIIPEGLPDDDIEFSSNNINTVESIKDFIDSADEDYIDYLVNYLRDVLLEMEQEGLIEDNTTDDLDDLHDGDWISWIKDVIDLPDLPEEALSGILDIINTNNNSEINDDSEIDDSEIDDSEIDDSEIDDSEIDDEE